MDSQRILDFWFGTSSDNQTTAQLQGALWWSKNEAVDQRMRTEFADWVEAAAQGRLAFWQQEPDSYLALILLLDQFPRNIYRGTARAFAYDAQALALSQEGVAKGFDRRLREIQRVFFYLPFEHAEDMAAQQQSLALFRQLQEQARPDERDLFGGYLDYAVRHEQVIAAFGRFPHRNAILGRPSSEEERTFLSQPGSSF